MTSPRVYVDKHLEYVMMPIGGIGTGTIWVDGKGRLAVWQIFNNGREPRVPDSFFAVQVEDGKQPPFQRILQTVAEYGFSPFKSLSFEGGYPIARIDFNDEETPIRISMEAFNPMIPLDVGNSSIPCALFRLTAENPTMKPVQVRFLGNIQNAVGFRWWMPAKGIKSACYGGNINVVHKSKNLAAIVMSQKEMIKTPGRYRIADRKGKWTKDLPLVWLDCSMYLDEGMLKNFFERTGGGIVLTGLESGLPPGLSERFRKNRAVRASAIVFDDFEKGYDKWRVAGTCFGDAPAIGTLPKQQEVSGFQGQGLANSFLGGDEAQGEMVSCAFPIQRSYISFLIGGGNYGGETCLNLVIDGRVMRTATGKNSERLEPFAWNVSEFKGKQAHLAIVDRRSGAWGHINVDQIMFADGPVVMDPLERIFFEFGIDLEKLAAKKAVLSKSDGYDSSANGCRTVDPLISGGSLAVYKDINRCRVVLCQASNHPWSQMEKFLLAAHGKPLAEGEMLMPEENFEGTMAMAAFSDDSFAIPQTIGNVFAFSQSEKNVKKLAVKAESPAGETLDGTVVAPLRLAPGEKKSVTFAITWRFPNVNRFNHLGNAYCRRWPDALAVAKDLAERMEDLWGRTLLYHHSVYQSNLPEEFIDAMTSQSVIVRGPTCFVSGDGYFGGYEGSYGSCPLNCTHVWNYAQSHARLFPKIGRNMRISDFNVYLKPSGETSHRQHGEHGAFIDGHCASIEAALREYQTSPDTDFLPRIWPGVKRAVEWMIKAFDADHDGVPAGSQWNTYDCAVSG
ncbi:MAG: GH116 family glycosyl-hydrolase [Verrucomicrobiae bacterium]|nr:GH116 family glycosyl-hydrolase [Verrucomicrobiae bacterium]